jgi:hypothetical protein
LDYRYYLCFENISLQLMNDWKSVYRYDQGYRVEIVKAALEDHDLPSVILDKKDSAYQLGHCEG